MNNEKKYEMTKDNLLPLVVTESQVAELLLSEGFMSLFKRLEINDSMYNYEKKADFKRIE